MNKNVDLMSPGPEEEFCGPYWSSIEDIFNNVPTRYTSKWSHYFPLYERYFNKFRGQKPVVLEVGIDNGGFLEVLNYYFGDGCQIYGMDIRQKCWFPEENYFLFIGDQGNETHLDDLKTYMPPPDIIIDDGSHFSEHQILTFKKLFPYMNEGGVYFVEDTHSSYMDTFGGKRNKPGTFIEWCKFIPDALHEDWDDTAPEGGWQSREGNLYRHIESIHFHDSVVVFDKKLRQKSECLYHLRDSYIR